MQKDVEQNKIHVPVPAWKFYTVGIHVLKYLNHNKDTCIPTHTKSKIDHCKLKFKIFNFLYNNINELIKNQQYSVSAFLPRELHSLLWKSGQG